MTESDERSGETGEPGPHGPQTGHRQEPARPRLAVIDDDTLIRDGVSTHLDEFDVLTARSLEEFVTQASTVGHVDLVIADLHISGPAGRPTPVQGRRIITELVADGRRCLIYTNERRRLPLAGCLAAGAHGIVHKTEPVAALRAAVHKVMAGGLVITPTVTGLVEVVANAGKLPTLTGRQSQVLRYRARGESFTSIARQLYISERTAEDHMSAVVIKFASFLATHSPADLERELGIGPGDLME